MGYLYFLKNEYIFIIILMYLCLFTFLMIRNKYPIIGKYNTSISNLFFMFYVTRSITFNNLKEYHENDIRHEIGILKSDITFPIIILCVVFLIVALVILYDVRKTKRMEVHEFNIINNNIDEFKKVLHSLKASGVKVFDDKVVNKRNELIMYKVRFYDVSYKEAFNYSNEFYKNKDKKSPIVKSLITIMSVCFIDIAFQLYRINSSNYTTIFEYIGELFR